MNLHIVDHFVGNTRNQLRKQLTDQNVSRKLYWHFQSLTKILIPSLPTFQVSGWHQDHRRQWRPGETPPWQPPSYSLPAAGTCGWHPLGTWCSPAVTVPMSTSLKYTHTQHQFMTVIVYSHDCHCLQSWLSLSTLHACKFTPDRHVHSNTTLITQGSIQPCHNYNVTYIHSFSLTTVYSHILCYTLN